MSALHKTARTPTLLADKLRELERQGRYSQALNDYVELVDGKARVPISDDASNEEKAELMLRYGALIGFLGHMSQIASSQEQSKDLLTQALGEYIGLGIEEKVAECENYLALSYWRTGELKEADVWLNSSLRRSIPRNSDARLHSHIVNALVALQARRFATVVRDLASVESDFIENGDPFLLGCFNNNLGLSLKDLGRTGEALERFELSRDHHSRSGHRVYSGTAANNIAQLYRLGGDFEKAHAACDDATKVFRSIKDKTREGFSYDTKANIFIAEKRFLSALRAVDKAIDILKRSENAAYQVESLITRSKILLNLDRFADAVVSLFEAVEIQRVAVGEAAARELISEFEAELKSTGKYAAPRKETSNGLQLLLPATLADFANYTAIRISSDHLHRYGLQKDSLAIIVEAEVKRGDLAAVELIADRSIRCGIFDKDFGLVSLDRGGSEPELYDENDVRIVGKIIGVGRGLPEVNGEVIVQPLTN